MLARAGQPDEQAVDQSPENRSHNGRDQIDPQTSALTGKRGRAELTRRIDRASAEGTEDCDHQADK
jgi:hypothetical protein